MSLTTNAPYWTHMARLLIDEQTNKGGQTIAPVIQQAREFLSSKRLQIIIGGYRYKPPQTATIIERRHEFFSLAQGWEDHGDVIQLVIQSGLSYKTILRKALYLFAVGIKDKIHGSGVNLCDLAEVDYYQQTENRLHQCLATINFNAPDSDLESLNSQLKETATNIFNQVTEPYRQEPKMLKALALARRSLHKSLKELEPQGVAND